MEQAKQIVLWLVRSFVISRRSDLKVVLMCFLAATTFWFLNALNKDYSARLVYPIKFTYDDSTYMATQKIPQRIALNVSGYGWNLLRKSLFAGAAPLNYTIQNPGRVQYVTSLNLLPVVTEQLSDIRINYIIDDTLFFAFDRKIQKRVALRVDSARLDLKENFRITSPITLQPDSLTFTGPANLINKIPNQLFIDIPAQDIDDNFEESIEVDFTRDALITVSDERVLVSFNTAQFVREVQRVPIQTVNFPVKNPPALPSPEAEVSYWVPIENRNTARLHHFRLAANFETFNPSDSTIVLTVIMRPGFSRDVQPVQPVVKLRYE